MLAMSSCEANNSLYSEFTPKRIVDKTVDKTVAKKHLLIYEVGRYIWVSKGSLDWPKI